MSQWPDHQAIKAIAKERDTNVVVIGNRVYEASEYAPDLVCNTRQKYLLLNHYHAGLPLAECASKVNMDLDKAAEFIDSPKAVAWLQREAVKDYAKQKWADGGEWVLAGDECLEGKKHLAKDQQVVFQAFGERFFPKKKETSEGSKTVINFNFSAKDVQDAFRRQESIDAELAQ